MALHGAQLTYIPVYLEADSKDELMRKMFLNNQLNGTKHNYMQPVLEGEKWVVWFYSDIENYKSVDDLDDDQVMVLKEFTK